MIHTERGKLTGLIEMMIEDRHYVSEALGVGLSGMKSRDKTLLNESPREERFKKRLENQTAIIEILKGML